MGGGGEAEAKREAEREKEGRLVLKLSSDLIRGFYTHPLLLLPFLCLCTGSIPVDRSYSSANILLDEVRCTGNEPSLFECDHAPLKSHDCVEHTELAGVRCGGMYMHVYV